MHTPDEITNLSIATGPKPEEIDASAGYEQTDVRVTGIVVFLTALADLCGGQRHCLATASGK